jgi:hypothetical protein
MPSVLVDGVGTSGAPNWMVASAGRLTVCRSSWSVFTLIACPCDVKNACSAVPLTGICGDARGCCEAVARERQQ